VTTSPGTSIHTQVRLTGGLPVRFARRGAPGEPVPSPASTSTAGRTARTRLNVDDAWCEALFASALQRSAAPAAESVAAAISRAVRRLGTRGCVSRMAQEFGDHRPASGVSEPARAELPPSSVPMRVGLVRYSKMRSMTAACSALPARKYRAAVSIEAWPRSAWTWAGSAPPWQR